MTVNEADETFKRLIACKGVEGVIIMNSEGIPVRSTMPNTQTVLYISLIHGLALKAKSVIKDMDHQNELTFIRLRSHKGEVLIAPDKEFTMIVVQNPNCAPS